MNQSSLGAIAAKLERYETARRAFEREIEIQRKGGEGRLIFKTNGLVDRQIIDLLYRASQAGVRCDLLVRGICCLRPKCLPMACRPHAPGTCRRCAPRPRR